MQTVSPTSPHQADNEPATPPLPHHPHIVPEHPPPRPARPAGRFSFLRSLRWRLALGFVAFLVVAMVLLAIFLVATVRPYLRSESLNSIEVAALRQVQAHKKTFESEVQVHLGEPSPAFEDTIGEALGGLTDVQQVLLVDPRSEVVVAARPGDLVGQQAPNFDRMQLLQKVRGGGDSVTYRSPDGNTGIILIGMTCQSCTGAGTHNFVIEVLTDFGSVSTIIGRLLFLLAIGMAGLVVLATIIGIPLIRRALRPLNQMTATTQMIAAGDLSQRVNLPHSGDEIGELSSSFDEMIERIEVAFAAQQESERRMRQFVADASHELRTPLTSLRGFTDVLLRGAKDDPEDAEKVLRSMQRECERMSRLVHDLLTLARLDTGRQINRGRFDLVELVGEAVDQARILAGSRMVTMRSDGGGPLFIMADQDKIKQVLLILLDNALKYGRQGQDGWVRVQISRAPDTAQLLVTDNGQGIRQEDLPHIFERFYRADKTRSRITAVHQLGAPGGPVSATGVLKAMNAGGSGLACRLRSPSSRRMAAPSGPAASGGKARSSPSACRGRRGEMRSRASAAYLAEVALLFSSSSRVKKNSFSAPAGLARCEGGPRPSNISHSKGASSMQEGGKKATKGFTSEERAAMRARAQEQKADAEKADGEREVLEKIAALPTADRALAERLHALIKASAPTLSPKTWYGMPAYAKDGQIVCFFQSAEKFKTRYASLGFSDKANLDDGGLWPIAYALSEWNEAVEEKIAALVKKAVS